MLQILRYISGITSLVFAAGCTLLLGFFFFTPFILIGIPCMIQIIFILLTVHKKEQALNLADFGLGLIPFGVACYSIHHYATMQYRPHEFLSFYRIMRGLAPGYFACFVYYLLTILSRIKHRFIAQ